jgi:hypothetical protein
MNSTTVSGIKLKVSISRNQPIEFGEKGVNSWNAIGKHCIENFIGILINYFILKCILNIFMLKLSYY